MWKSAVDFAVLQVPALNYSIDDLVAVVSLHDEEAVPFQITVGSSTHKEESFTRLGHSGRFPTIVLPFKSLKTISSCLPRKSPVSLSQFKAKGCLHANQIREIEPFRESAVDLVDGQGPASNLSVVCHDRQLIIIGEMAFEISKKNSHSL